MAFTFKRTFRKRRRALGTRKKAFKRSRTVFKKRVKNAVLSMAEHKYLQNTVPNAGSSQTTPVNIPLNILSVGASRNQRLGNVIQVARVRATVAMNSVTGAVPLRVRVLIYADRQWNGGLAYVPGTQIPDLFMDPGSANWYQSPYNVNTVGKALRYKIYYDRFINLQVDGGATDKAQLKTLKIDAPIRCRTQYNEGNAGTVQDINRNMLYFLIISNDNVSLLASNVMWQMFFTDV